MNTQYFCNACKQWKNESEYSISKMLCRNCVRLRLETKRYDMGQKEVYSEILWSDLSNRILNS